MSIGLWILPNGVAPATRVPVPAPVRAPANVVSTIFAALSRCGPGLRERDRWHIAAVIHRESERHGYDPLFVLAMIHVESTCAPTARSHRGAIGLIQVKPSTARFVAAQAGLPWRGARSLTTPAINVQLGLRYLRQLEEQFHDPRIAVAAYNLGPTRVAQMPRWRARRAPYVRAILSRYEDLLRGHAARGPRPAIG